MIARWWRFHLLFGFPLADRHGMVNFQKSSPLCIIFLLWIRALFWYWKLRNGMIIHELVGFCFTIDTCQQVTNYVVWLWEAPKPEVFHKGMPFRKEITEILLFCETNHCDIQKHTSMCHSPAWHLHNIWKTSAIICVENFLASEILNCSCKIRLLFDFYLFI